MKETMGIDQYGEHYDALGEHPRAALLARLGYRHAERMYVDKTSGGAAHIGYVIGGRWITLYRVEAWEQAA